MVVAVFSDIHGNVHSLETALKKMQEYAPEKYLFLGDMAGYFYYQNESIKLLNTVKNLVSLKGNHDDNFLKALEDKTVLQTLEGKYGKSYPLLVENISEEGLQFFKGLKLYEKTEEYEAYHGSPRDFLEEYLYPDKTIDFHAESKIVFTGHTHYPMEKKVKESTFINPGSIGQPRDHSLGAFAIVDTKDLKVEQVRYEYDKSSLIKKIQKLKDKEYLLEVLQRERK